MPEQALVSQASGAPSLFKDFVHDLKFGDLPADVVAFAQRCVLDLSGVAAGAIGTDLSRMIRDHAVDNFGAGGRTAQIIFDGRDVSPVGAALAGGMTIDALDAHDGHRLTKGHAGCSVFPATLALAQAVGCNDGREFLTAIVIGYEVGTRAGIALHETACDYHTSGAWGAVACAAVGARLLGLNSNQTQHAVGIAEYHGPRSQMMRCIDHPTMLKDGSGWGAMAGVSAALLATDGFTGAPALTVEEGRVAEIWSDLGHRWYLQEQYFKPHPVCRWAQPAVEAALALQAEHGFTAREVSSIEIHSFHEALRLGTDHPQTTEQAQYGLGFPVAAAIANGHLGPAQVKSEALVDPVVLSLTDKISLVESDAYNDAFPSRRYAHVRVALHDGSSFESSRTEPRGDPEAHLSTPEMIEKFHIYSDPVVGRERSSQIRQAVDALSGPDSMSELLAGLIPQVD